MADKYTQDFIDEVKGCLNSGNGGSGADDVARAAIEAHAGNADIHLTAEQLNTAVNDATEGGKTVEKAAAYTLDNAVDYPLVDMRIYGKSTQDGEPSPENPVEIVSVESPTVTVCGKNLINIQKPEIIAYSVQDAIKSATFELENNGMTLKSGTTNVTWAANKWWWKIKKGIYTISCKISCDDEAFTPQLGIFYRENISSTNIHIHTLTPSKSSITFTLREDVYLGLYFHLTDDNGITAASRTVRYYDIQLELGDTATAYEPYIGSTASLTSALPLCGIPVTEDGNYTDSNGQQWICDELIYNADGTGKIVKRMNEITLDGSDDENWALDATVGDTMKKRLRFYAPPNIVPLNDSNKYNSKSPSRVICDKYDSATTSETWNRTKKGISITHFDPHGYISVYDETYSESTLDEWKSYLASNPVTVVYPLNTPQEISLTAEEMSQLQSLQTFDGVTNVSNDKGAEMQIKYCTNSALSEYVKPIKTGLQKQIDELKTAVLSLGGNV